jgi:hypothetical protein
VVRGSENEGDSARLLAMTFDKLEGTKHETHPGVVTMIVLVRFDDANA